MEDEREGELKQENEKKREAEAAGAKKTLKKSDGEKTKKKKKRRKGDVERRGAKKKKKTNQSRIRRHLQESFRMWTAIRRATKTTTRNNGPSLTMPSTTWTVNQNSKPLQEEEKMDATRLSGVTTKT